MKNNGMFFCLVAIALVGILGISIANASAKRDKVINLPRGNSNPPVHTTAPAALPNPTAMPPIAEIGGATAEVPDNAEFFQLSLPLPSKPYLGGTPNPPIGTPSGTPIPPIRAIVWNALIDHTTPFYTRTTDLTDQPYTGEIAVRPTDSPPTPTVQYRGPSAYGVTPNNRIYFYNGHSGLDLNANIGTPVYAAHAGVVVLAGSFGTYGIAVIIKDAENPTFFTLYGHLSDVSRIHQYSRVARGQLIALSGNTGAGTGAHLHFGTYQNAVDDMNSANVLDPYRCSAK